ncbi:MAG: response regulator [Planctomycetes bacterium]|nr:response regulator [Planctomycetota bacterium]
MVRTVEAGQLVRAGRDLGDRLGYTDAELARRPLVDWIHPADRSALAALMLEPGGTVCARHATRSGEWLAMTWRLRREGPELFVLGLPSSDDLPPVGGADGGPSGEQSKARMLESMARIVESKNPGNFCSILLIDRSRNCVTVGAGPSLPAEYNAAVEGLEIGPAVGSCGTAAYWNVPVIVENINEDPLWRNLREAAKLAGVAACWSHPILAMNGDVLGAMALYDTRPGRPTRHQMDGLEIAARMVGMAVEREQFQAQLRQAAKMEALGVLAGGVAHDFNNLLGVMLGNAELGARKSEGSSELRGMFEQIVAAAGSAATLCTQMLAYAGRSAVTAEAVECNALIRELSKLVEVSLSKKATLHFDLVGELAVRADRGHLNQVILNLITNAAQAVGNNEGEVRVSTRGITLPDPDLVRRGLSADTAAGDYVEIEVRDSGCGMSAETKARIFDPFFTTKADGRGLGLAAVKGIVTTHGWQLLVESEPGEGAVFTLVLPRTRVESVPAPVVTTCPAPAASRVLVVDDEPGVLKVVSKMLRYVGIDVVQASNGQQAIDIYREQADSIDGVVLDLNMPKLDGEEVFKELKLIRPDVRVLLTSGYAEQAVLDRFRGTGLCGVVQKPIKMAVLHQKVGEILANAGVRA